MALATQRPTANHTRSVHNERPVTLGRAQTCPACFGCTSRPQSSSQPQFTIRRDVNYTSCVQPGLTVHLKGFASRINFEDQPIFDMAKHLIRRLKALEPSRVVWDGDNFGKESFTRLIPYIHRELGGAVELVAFLRECDQERFTQSWEATGLPVSLYLCPSALDWQKLGTHALEVTGSEMVVCYGGGGTVTDEFAAKPNADVKFTMFAINRPTSDGADIEYSALSDANNASLEVVVHSDTDNSQPV